MPNRISAAISGLGVTPITSIRLGTVSAPNLPVKATSIILFIINKLRGFILK
jgi:hypothetical protein